MTMTLADYDQLASGTTATPKLLAQVTCPHCWEYFAPEDVLWISEHVDLLGDPLLGPERQQRFLPSRYTLQGDAIDAKGMTCAKPGLPQVSSAHPPRHAGDGVAVHLDPGSPASGKSYFLTAMTWQLRQILPAQFQVAFTDADPASNRTLNECEESLFLNPDERRSCLWAA